LKCSEEATKLRRQREVLLLLGDLKKLNPFGGSYSIDHLPH
jgi:hypothetical protein